MRQTATEQDRFWSKVDRSGECWLWTAGTNRDGYGAFRRANRGKMVKAHRYAFAEAHGEIPEGTELDHLCRVRRCVNPTHLEPVAHAENMRRARSEVCSLGHVKELMPSGRWRCRRCDYDRSNAWAKEQRAAAGALTEGSGAHQKRRTECPYGHAYTEENTYRDKKGSRSCLTCRRERSRRR